MPSTELPRLHEEHVRRALSGTAPASQIKARDYTPARKIRTKHLWVSCVRKLQDASELHERPQVWIQ